MKKEQVKYVGALVALLALGTSASAESLNSTLASALQSNPQVQRASLGVQISQAQSAQVRAQSWGRLDATAGTGLNNFDGYSPIAPKTLYKPKNAGFNFSIPLYTSGRLTHLQEAAGYGEAAALASKQSVEQQILLNAGAAYLALAQAQDLAGLATKQKELLKVELARAKAELQAGLRTKTDVAQAQARVAKAQAALEQAQASVKEAQANYEAVVGRLPAGELQALDLSFDQDLSSYLAAVRATNPLLHAATSRISQASAHYQAVKSEDQPSITLNAGITTDRQSNPFLLKESAQSIGVQITIPLYDGGASNAKKSEARLSLASVESEMEDLSRELTAQATGAWENFHGVRAEESAREEQVKAAEVALEGAKRELSAGTRTLLDVLNAEQELLEAKTSSLQAHYQKAQTVLRLQALTAQLSPISH